MFIILFELSTQYGDYVKLVRALDEKTARKDLDLNVLWTIKYIEPVCGCEKCIHLGTKVEYELNIDNPNYEG